MRYLLASAVVLVVIGQSVSAQGVQAPPASERVYEPGNGISSPVPLLQPQPNYTAQALRQRISGEVWLDVVVKADGTVTDVNVRKSLDQIYGLDDEAIAAAKRWLFRPGHTREGKAVAVRVTLVMEFQTGGQLTDASFREGTVSDGTPGFAHAIPITRTEAKYTADAMRAKLQGVVEVDAVVSRDGRVLRTRVTNSLDRRFGLDEEAEIAVRQWRFQPATVNGIAVDSVAHVSVPFKLH